MCMIIILWIRIFNTSYRFIFAILTCSPCMTANPKSAHVQSTRQKWELIWTKKCSNRRILKRIVSKYLALKIFSPKTKDQGPFYHSYESTYFLNTYLCQFKTHKTYKYKGKFAFSWHRPGGLVNEIINYCLSLDFFFGNLQCMGYIRKAKRKPFQPILFGECVLSLFLSDIFFWAEKNRDDMVTKIVMNTMDYLREMCLNVQNIFVRTWPSKFNENLLHFNWK